jgi:hypothetical protein
MCAGPDGTVDAHLAFDPLPCGLLTAGQRAFGLAVIKTKSSLTSNPLLRLFTGLNASHIRPVLG